MTTTIREGVALSPFVAAEIRSVIGRQGTSAKEVAAQLGRPAAWMSRRIGKTADVDVTFDEVAQIAQALDVDVEGLVLAALRACRDSNPKPSDLVSDHGPECWCDSCQGGPNRLVSRVAAPFDLRRCGVCGAWTMDGRCRTPHGSLCQVGTDAVWTLAA